MLALEDEIATLSELDALRIEAKEMLLAGLRGLGGSSYTKHERWEEARLDRTRVEHALLLRTMRTARKRGWSPDGEHSEALERTAHKFVGSITACSLLAAESGHMPILIAGRALEALATTPGCAMTKASVTCYYLVLRELFSSEPPLWAMGSARAGEGSQPTAFVTGECCRGVLWLSRSFSRAAQLCFKLRGLHSRRAGLAATPRTPLRWKEVELNRIQKALEIDIIWMRHRTVFTLDHLNTENLNELAVRLASQIDTMDCQVVEARRDIQAMRAMVVTAVDGDGGPHRVAFTALDDLGERLRRVATSLRAGDWGKAGERLTEIAGSITDHLGPSRNYVGAVLDHELAAAAEQRSDRDLPELVFAAAAYGMLDGTWDDPRLCRAADVVVASITSGGRLPAGRPFLVEQSGSQLHPVGSEVVRAMATLLGRKHKVITPEVVASMVRLFRDSQRPVPGGIGWAPEAPIDPKKASWWTTALSIIALERVVMMLNSCLNARVAMHFYATHGERLKVTLDDTFYPDYGLVRPDRPSVAVLMQRMRAHVLGIPSPDYRDPLGSIVLYGPPGTGKTTLAEALARSSGARFVHVTPSDIVLGGAEHAEHRARVVFEALTMLTDTVILFDEFDSLLRRRPTDGRVPRSIFELLTPGMLPKLERLHVAARDRRVAFVLATNLVGSLDNAAIRAGRFDEKVGIYPPDLLSRLGRMLFVKLPGSVQQEERLLRACTMTHDSPMSTLGRRGWFSFEDAPKDGTAQAYIDDPSNVPRWPTPEFNEVRPSGEGKHAEMEFAEWLWSRTADVRIVGGPEPFGDLREYLRATSWIDLRTAVARSTVTWEEVNAALEARPEWDPFFTWVGAGMREGLEAGASDNGVNQSSTGVQIGL